MSLCPHGYTAFWDCPTCPAPMGEGEAPRACDICGYSGADHETPKGTWIHANCGRKAWEREAARLNRKASR